MNLLLKTFLVFALFCSAFSCSYNKSEMPVPQETITNNPVITFTSHVQDIMTNCTVCHFSGVGSQSPALVTYTDVKAQADAGRILARAINASGGPMPTGGLMPQTTLDTLQMWLDQGALQ
jgi:hypothetical protein